MPTPAADIVGDALLRAFAERGYQATLQDPTTVAIVLPDGTRLRTDITAWRGYAEGASPADVSELAASYVRQAAAAIERQTGHSQTEQILASGNLRMRLYTEEALGQMREALVTRPLAPGLLETVVVDYPDSIMPLNRADIGNTPENGVFGTALALSIGKEPHYAQMNDVGGVPVMHIGGTHRYVSAHVHVLSRHVFANIAPYGALVSFPVPEYVIVHSIGNPHLFIAMEAVQTLTRRHFEVGEKAVSPQVYWWRPGPHEQLPEEAALHSGLVPDLRPVGIQIDQQTRNVVALTEHTNELIALWLRDHNA